MGWIAWVYWVGWSRSANCRTVQWQKRLPCNWHNQSPLQERKSRPFYLYCSRVLKRLGALAPVEPITLSPEMLLQNHICCPNHTGMTLLSNGCKCESSNDKCDKIVKDERRKVSPNAATMLMSPGCNSFTLRFKWQLSPPTLFRLWPTFDAYLPRTLLRKNKIAARVGVGQNYSRFLVRQAEGNHRTGSKDEGSSIKCEEQLVLNLNRVFKSEQRAILPIWSAWFKTTQMPGGTLITVRLTCPLQELCGWWRCMGRASYVLDTENLILDQNGSLIKTDMSSFNWANLIDRSIVYLCEDMSTCMCAAVSICIYVQICNCVQLGKFVLVFVFICIDL